MEEFDGDVPDLLYNSRMYRMQGSEVWIDVKNLTINIQKMKTGLRIEVYPAEHDGQSGPLARCQAEWPDELPAPTKRV
jgi:hypothetical protein